MSSAAFFSAALAGLARALKSERWCIGGAQAAITYGATRATQDIDLSVLASPEHSVRILSLMQREGFAPRIEPRKPSGLGILRGPI